LLAIRKKAEFNVIVPRPLTLILLIHCVDATCALLIPLYFSYYPYRTSLGSDTYTSFYRE
jgi:hypothetical protein